MRLTEKYSRLWCLIALVMIAILCIIFQYRSEGFQAVTAKRVEEYDVSGQYYSLYRASLGNEGPVPVYSKSGPTTFDTTSYSLDAKVAQYKKDINNIHTVYSTTYAATGGGASVADAAALAKLSDIATQASNAVAAVQVAVDAAKATLTAAEKASLANTNPANLIAQQNAGKALMNAESTLLYAQKIYKNVLSIQTANTYPAQPIVANELGSLQTSSLTTACSELAELRRHFMAKIAELRKAMNDLSGTEKLGFNSKSENMKYQYQFNDKCNNLMAKTEMLYLDKKVYDGCINLASQDEVLYNSILPAYDTTNLTLYEQEWQINEFVQTINDTMKLIKCDVSGFSFSADNDVGYIDIYELRAKLDELSPYYISSGTLDFVTAYLVGNGILDTALYSSTEILKEVNGGLKSIQGIANGIFGVPSSA
jgi:hypothetical protein